MSNWTLLDPEATENEVLNPSAEAEGNYGMFLLSPSTSPSASASRSASRSASPSGSTSRSPSRSASPSGSASISPSSSASISPSASASPSGSASASPSPSSAVATVTRSTTYARFGAYSYFVNTAAAFDEVAFELKGLANAIHYVSTYALDVSGTLQASLDGSTWHDCEVIGGRTGGWVRYGVQVPAAQASGSATVYFRDSAAEDYYLDGLQVEAKEYPTTYCDGDVDGDGALFRWTGLRHASASTRSAQYRAGGRERDLFDDYAITVTDDSKRLGLPPVTLNWQGKALAPGAFHQGHKLQPRGLELALQFTVADAGSEAATWAAFRAKRQQLIDLIKPDRVRGSQPVILGYGAAGARLYGAYHYSGGLESFGDLLHVDEVATVRLSAPDPFWYEDNRETAALDFQDSDSVGRVLARLDGSWALPAALIMGSGTVNAIAVDKQRGRVYVAGTFPSTANLVEANGICYWDGSDFVGMDEGVDNADVRALAVAPNGDVWIGGDFTLVGSGAAASQCGLARWNVSSGTWTVVEITGMTAADIYTLAIEPDGRVWAGGTFTASAGDNLHIAYTDDNGSNWSGPGTGMNDTVRAVAIHPDGNVYVGGEFTTGNGVTLNGVGYWNGTTFVALGTTGLSGGSADAYALAIGRDGTVYAGGSFTAAGGVSASNIAGWNGAGWRALGSGVNNTVHVLTAGDDGLLYAGGTFTSAGGLTLADRIALWNGYSWSHLDVDLPGTPQVNALAFWQGNLYLGFSTSGTATFAGRTTVTPAATVTVYPTVTLIGPSSASCTLQSLENQSAGERQFYNLAVQAGETVTIETVPEVAGVTSDWRGFVPTQPLSNSDDLSLLPVANTIAAFITGTTTGVSLLMHWQPAHGSIDGAAV